MLRRRKRIIRRYTNMALRDYVAKMVFIEAAKSAKPLTVKQRNDTIERAKKDYAAIVKAVNK